jgi:hypothetical protein
MKYYEDYDKDNEWMILYDDENDQPVIVLDNLSMEQVHMGVAFLNMKDSYAYMEPEQWLLAATRAVLEEVGRRERVQAGWLRLLALRAIQAMGEILAFLMVFEVISYWYAATGDWLLLSIVVYFIIRSIGVGPMYLGVK